MIHSQPLMTRWDNGIHPFPPSMQMLFGYGLEIITPDFIMPKFELEPFTEDELRGMAHRAYWYKRANTLKFRSIIRKHKQATTI